MADGTSKPIEQVALGDRVRTGPSRAERATVIELLQRESEDLYEIRFQALVVGAPERRLVATGDHWFWVDGAGWTQARQLAAGDWLTTVEQKRAEVRSVQRLPGRETVYSFVAREDHAFYAEGVLVQDGCALQRPGARIPAGQEVIP